MRGESIVILETIHSPADVKAMNPEQLEQLCREMRTFLVESVSKPAATWPLIWVL